MRPSELVDVVVGCSVYDKAPDVDPDEAEHMRGGVVWSVDRHRVDDELVDVYRALEPYRGGVRWSTLAGPLVAQWAPPSSSSIRAAVRLCAKVVATGKGALDSEDLRALEAALALAKSL